MSMLCVDGSEKQKVIKPLSQLASVADIEGGRHSNGECSGDDSAATSPRSFQSATSSHRAQPKRPGQDALLRSLIEKLGHGRTYGATRRGSVMDSAPSTPNGAHSGHQYRGLWGGASRLKVNAVNTFRRHSVSAPPTPGGADHYLSRQWDMLMARSLMAPKCEIDGRVVKKMITGIKGAVYVRIVNADDLMKPVGEQEIDFTIRSGPANSEVNVSMVEHGRVFKLEFRMYISGRYHIALSCRKKRIPNTPFTVDVSPCKTHPKFTIARDHGLSKGIAGKQGVFTIVARDQGGNKRKKGGDTFTVEFNGPSEMKWAHVEDLEDGSYTVTYFPTCAGWYDIFIILNDEILAECPYHLFIDPGDLSAKQSIILFNGTLESAAGEPTSFDLQARDAYCNNIGTGGRSFTGAMRRAKDKSLVPLNFRDNGDGIYTGTFTAESAGLYRAFVKAESPINSENFIPCPLCSSLMARIKPGPAYASNCVTEDLGLEGYRNGAPLEAIAGHWVTFVVLSFDRCGNRRVCGGHDVRCTVRVKEMDKSLSSMVVRDNTSNSAKLVKSTEPTASIMEKVERSIQAKISDKGKPAMGKLINCDGLDGSEAGVTAHFEIFSADIFGNRLRKGGEHFQVELVGPGFVPGTVHDNEDGTYAVSYRAIKSGRYHIHVLLNRRLIAGSPYSVFIKNARTIQSHVAMLGLGFRQAVANQVTTLKLLALDKSNDPMTGGGDTFEVTLTLKLGTSCRVRTLRECTELLSEAEVEAIQQKAVEERRARMRAGVGRSRTMGRVSLRVLEMFRDHLPNDWNSENTVASGQEPCPGNADVAHSLFRAKLQEMRDQLSNFSYEEEDDLLSDYYSQSLANRYDTESYETACKGLDLVEHNMFPATVVDNRDGTYQVTYSPTVAGEYAWTIMHNGQDISPADETVHVSPSTIDKDESVMYGYGMRYAVAGELAHAVLQGADRSGNALKEGKDSVEVEIYKEFVHPTQDSDILLPVNVADLEDGRYLVTFLATCAGTYIGEVKINGKEAPSLAFKTHVYPTLVDPTMCKVTGDATTKGTAGRAMAFYIQACDAFGNERHFGGDRFFVTLSPKSYMEELDGNTGREDEQNMGQQRTDTHGTATSLGNGCYKAEYRVTVAGSYTLKCTYKNPDMRQAKLFFKSNVNVIPGDPFPTSCIVGGAGLLGSPPRMVGVVTVMIADQWGNYRSLDPFPDEMVSSNVAGRKRITRPASAGPRSSKASVDGEWQPGSYKPFVDPFDTGDSFFDKNKGQQFKMHTSKYSNGAQELQVSLTQVIDGRDLPGGVATIGERIESFQSWFESTGSERKKRMPANRHQPNIKLYTISYRTRSIGNHKLRLTLNGVDITGSPFPLTTCINPSNEDPVELNPESLTDVSENAEAYVPNPTSPKLSPFYILNSAQGPRCPRWQPPSAPSIDSSCCNGEFVRKCQSSHQHLRKSENRFGRRAGFSKKPVRFVGEVTKPGGKTMMVFGDWAKGVSRLVSEQLVEGKRQTQIMEGIDARTRSDRQKYEDFLVSQIKGMIQ
ncbi:hypothetical protein BSKO_09488 [Bryopsis sp. KO-2023]|nr:hypothetical protein BSKO_09488 [Bryopsis sp. KO-2023]